MGHSCKKKNSPFVVTHVIMRKARTVVPDAIGQSLKTPLNRRVSDPVSKSQEHFA